MRSRYLCLLGTLSCVACSQASSTLSNGDAALSAGDTVTMSAVPGVVIARDSLTAINDNLLPCCSVDSAGVRVQVTAGTMTFYAAAGYADSMFTPDGKMPRACVQEVPSGSHLARNNLLTLPDSESYLLLPCSAGRYSVTLTEQVGNADGSSTSRQVSLSSGRYAWSPRALSLTDQGTVSGATASMSGANITVTVPGHHYRFLAIPLP